MALKQDNTLHDVKLEIAAEVLQKTNSIIPKKYPKESLEILGITNIREYIITLMDKRIEEKSALKFLLNKEAVVNVMVSLFEQELTKLKNDFSRNQNFFQTLPQLMLDQILQQYGNLKLSSEQRELILKKLNARIEEQKKEVKELFPLTDSDECFAAIVLLKATLKGMIEGNLPYCGLQFLGLAPEHSSKKPNNIARLAPKTEQKEVKFKKRKNESESESESDLESESDSDAEIETSSEEDVGLRDNRNKRVKSVQTTSSQKDQAKSQPNNTNASMQINAQTATSGNFITYAFDCLKSLIPFGKTSTDSEYVEVKKTSLTL